MTDDFLKALLSPDGSQRARAETYWKSLPVEQRVCELMHALATTQSGPWQQQLVAVLLRRDILMLNSETLLQQLFQELLPLAAKSTSIGDCLTEIVYVLHKINESASILAMQTILQTSSDAVVNTKRGRKYFFLCISFLSHVYFAFRHTDIRWP